MGRSLIDEMSQVSDVVSFDLELRRREAAIPDADENEVDYAYLRSRREQSSGDYIVLL